LVEVQYFVEGSSCHLDEPEKSVIATGEILSPILFYGMIYNEIPAEGICTHVFKIDG
jgi:hypothetical protein